MTRNRTTKHIIDVPDEGIPEQVTLFVGRYDRQVNYELTSEYMFDYVEDSFVIQVVEYLDTPPNMVIMIDDDGDVVAE